MYERKAPLLNSSATADCNDGLAALTSYARRAADADVLLAFEAGKDGVAKPLAASPDIAFTPFSLTFCTLNGLDWNQGPVPAALVNLPGSISILLDQPPAQLWFLPAPVADQPNSGMLFIWFEAAAGRCDCGFKREMREQLSLMAPVFAQMLGDRSRLLGKRLAMQRFEDLFGSVPNGVVIFEGDGRTGLINTQMATLLGTAAGEKSVGEIAAAMRQLRGRCVNSDALEALYGPLQRDLDHGVRTVWNLGTQRLEVDTHPILGSGRNGRIWLFQDVTAQHVLDENLRTLALTDALTGLANRRHFFAASEPLLAKSTPPELAVAALMLDIDHFKTINDRYGHQGGDDVLREVSSRLKSVMRHEDLLARLGGEEFAVLLGGLTAPEIADVGERLIQAVAAEPVAAASAAIEVRISAGAAQRLGAENLDALMRRADQALYAAKAGGRNRLVCDFKRM